MNTNGLAQVMAVALATQNPARLDFGNGIAPVAKTQTALAGTTLYTVAGTLTVIGTEVRIAASAVPSADQVWTEIGAFLNGIMVARSLLPSIEVVSGKAINVTWFLPLEV